MTDTAILEWKCLMNEFYDLDLRDFAGIAKAMDALNEQEKYMRSKGFQVGVNKMITPQGEVVWGRYSEISS